jgi:hypothetical protein
MGNARQNLTASKICTAAAAFALLSGCATMTYIVDNYRGIELREVATEDDTYRVFDRPDAGMMMVTSSVGAAAAQGIGRGLTFGAADTTPAKPLFQRAAERFLAETERAHCRITDGYLLISPQYEFKYDCTRPAAVTARPKR